MDGTTLIILLIFFGATLVRSTFGFGESLIAVPLLSLFIPIELAVPLAVLISVFIAALVLVQDHRKVHFKSAQWLIIFAVLGIPIGLLLLIYGRESVVKSALGIFIIGYALYALFSKRQLKLDSDHKAWLFLCGFISGILGGSYGLNGPPLVLYGNLRRWSARHFRATLQAYFLPAGIAGLLGFWYQGLLTSSVFYYFFIAIPVIVPAVFLGRYLNRQLKDGAFLKAIYIGLIGIGVVLLAQLLI